MMRSRLTCLQQCRSVFMLCLLALVLVTVLGVSVVLLLLLGLRSYVIAMEKGISPPVSGLYQGDIWSDIVSLM